MKRFRIVFKIIASHVILNLSCHKTFIWDDEMFGTDIDNNHKDGKQLFSQMLFIHLTDFSNHASKLLNPFVQFYRNKAKFFRMQN